MTFKHRCDNMIRINENYNQLKASYLFLEIANKVAQFQSENRDVDIIRLGIGDVTKSLPPACISAFHNGVDELASESTLKGYGPYNGYAFLRKKRRIRRYEPCTFRH